MNGLGNDYIIIDTRFQRVDEPQSLALKLSDRHFSIGGDGIVLIGESKVSDFSMRMFNPDGSEAEMCGNAIRCVGKYLYDTKATQKTFVSIQTKAGIKALELIVVGKTAIGAMVNMGEVKVNLTPIAVSACNRTIVGYAVNVGNPHFVVFVDAFCEDIMRVGKEISENESVFPMRTNVEFVLRDVINDKIVMRVYERGTGETLACGTGACAAFFACYKKKLVGETATVVLSGGELECYAVGNNVVLSGRADINFEGTIN